MCSRKFQSTLWAFTLLIFSPYDVVERGAETRGKKSPFLEFHGQPRENWSKKNESRTFHAHFHQSVSASAEGLLHAAQERAGKKIYCYMALQFLVTF